MRARSENRRFVLVVGSGEGFVYFVLLTDMNLRQYLNFGNLRRKENLTSEYVFDFIK